MVRAIPNWLLEVERALQRQADRDPFVHGALRAAQAFAMTEREMFVALVQHLSAERERLTNELIAKVTLGPIVLPVHDAINVELGIKCGGLRLVPPDVPREFQRSCPGCTDCGGRR